MPIRMYERGDMHLTDSSRIFEDVLRLPEDEVHLWMADCDRVDVGLRQAYALYMSPDEEARMTRFHFEVDRLRYLLTRALVRTTLSRYHPIPPFAWRFVENRYGCPRISPSVPGTSGIDFNLSHTTNCVILAVARSRAVGVDMEEGDRHAPLDVAGHCLAQAEMQALQALPPECRQERFLEYWTFKESYIKAKKMGLSIPLDQFHFELSDDGKVELHTHPELHEFASNWEFWQFKPQRLRLVALCAGAYPVPVRRIVWREVVPGRDEQVLDLADSRSSRKSRGSTSALR